MKKIVWEILSKIFSVAAVNCTDPPARPPSGTWEWNGNKEYHSKAQYTCGLYGKFENSNNEKYEVLESVCGWNKSWVPNVFDPCAATSCQYIPFPPSHLDMVYLPDDQNSLSLLSEMSIYNPNLPLSVPFPGSEFCENNGDILMIVGEIMKKKRGKQGYLEVVVQTSGTNEPFHMKIDLERDVIERWGVFNDKIEEVFGAPFEGTTIDYDEPFMLRWYPQSISFLFLNCVLELSVT